MMSALAEFKEKKKHMQDLNIDKVESNNENVKFVKSQVITLAD